MLYSILKKIRWLFDFHQPAFNHLDCIDLVFENKLLLLISWQAVHAQRICISPGKIKDYRGEGAAVYKLPAAADKVTITLRNIWRSKKITRDLKYIVVDQQAIQYINKQLQGAPGFYINVSLPAITMLGIQIKKPELQLPLQPQVIPFNIHINQHQLNDYVT